jgi:hypothetical protein
MHEHCVGLCFGKHAAHPFEHTHCYVGQVLTLLHYVEVEIGCDAEYVKNLVEHLPVLPGYGYYGVEAVAAPLQFLDYGRHFDGFGPGAEHKHYFFHCA